MDLKDKKFVITIGRQFGSGGHDIGKKLAEALSIPFYDKELLLVAAKESGLNPELFKKADEKLPSFYMSSLAINLGYYIQPFDSSPTADYYEKIQEAISDMIAKVADKGSCVIVGRCADYHLRDNKNSINIFICASEDACAERISQREGITKEDAINLAKKENKLRAEYYNFYTNKEWSSSGSYDLCIDSSKISEDDIIKIILAYIDIRLL